MTAEQITKTLARAQQNSSYLRIVYVDRGGQVSTREISIREITDRYVYAHCHWRDAARTLAIEGIQQVKEIPRLSKRYEDRGCEGAAL